MAVWRVKRDECIYTACYCEENIWKLCERWKQNDPDALHHLYAVLISNSKRQIPIWEQKSATNPEHLAVWDYHVILIDRSSPALVYDFDSTLPFPISAADYLRIAIREETNIARRYHRLFRVIPAQEYLDVFASDRSHMLKEDRITYNSPPPPYPPICTPKSMNNINAFIDMPSKDGPGTVMNLTDLRHFLKLE